MNGADGVDIAVRLLPRRVIWWLLVVSLLIFGAQGVTLAISWYGSQRAAGYQSMLQDWVDGMLPAERHSAVAPGPAAA